VQNATNKYKVLQQQAVLPVPISTEKENAIWRSSRKRVAFDVYNLLVIAIRFNFAAQQPHVV